jgi:hypothetical protein
VRLVAVDPIGPQRREILHHWSFVKKRRIVPG